MKNHCIHRTLLASIPLLVLSHACHAGSGFYLGADVVAHHLETATTTTYSPPGTTSSGDAEEDFTDWGLRTGYKFKSRLTDRYFWAPELAVSALDGDDLIYSTNLRIGYETAPVELFAHLGVSRIEAYTDNRLNYGAGLEYRLTNRASFTAQWTGYDTIDETTQSTVFIDSTRVDIDTRTERSLDTIRIGFTYYFQGSI